MTNNKISNMFCEAIIRRHVKTISGGSMLDSNNIVWKMVNDKWIGKRSVWTFDFRACWLEDTTVDNVKNWWCGGKNADYTEILYRNQM